MKRNNLYLVLAAIILLILFLYINKKETIVEGLRFDNRNLKKYYNEEGITLDMENELLIKGNKTLGIKRQMNTKQGEMNCNNKHLTSSILARNNLPVPKHYIWNNEILPRENLKEINNILNFPLVVKPSKGSMGIGVHMNNNNNEDILKSVRNISRNDRKRIILIEEQVIGDSYRILIFRNKIVGILKRVPPYVIGDGKTKLKTLIYNFNKKQLETKKYPVSMLAINYIREQGYDMDSIVENNKKVNLSLNLNGHNGSSLAEVNIEDVHPMNLKMFEKVGKILGITLAGIDYMSEDISKSYKETGYILEVNERPAINNHYDAQPEHVKKFVKMLF